MDFLNEQNSKNNKCGKFFFRQAVKNCYNILDIIRRYFEVHDFARKDYNYFAIIRQQKPPSALLTDYRQIILYSCSIVVLNYFIFGLYLGSPTVIVPQLRTAANSTDVVTPEMASWLSSTSVYCATPWVFILPILSYRFGRKINLILICLNVLIGNVIFYCSTSIVELIISQALQGMLVASITTTNIMVLSEYTSPEYRGFIITLKAATCYWGVLVSNTIGTFYHWKNIGIVIFVCGIYNFTACIFVYESPFWLATKRRFDECSRAHRWLKGTGESSEEELKKLILSQKNNRTNINDLKKLKINITVLHIFKQKSFYKPLVYACLPLLLYNATGKIACTVYAIDIFKKITSSERMAYEAMLILDAVTVASMYLGCALSKILTRRKQLLAFSSIGIGFLYILSIYLYMIKSHIVSENNYISLVLLIGFSICIGCGPIILGPCCSAELTPLKNRGYFLCCISIVSDILLATTLKISPLVFKLCGTPGTFMFYAVSSSVSIFVLYKYLPETKDRTIQEIEEHITRGVPYDTSTGKTDTIPLKESESK